MFRAALVLQAARCFGVLVFYPIYLGYFLVGVFSNLFPPNAPEDFS